MNQTRANDEFERDRCQETAELQGAAAELKSTHLPDLPDSFFLSAAFLSKNKRQQELLTAARRKKDSRAQNLDKQAARLAQKNAESIGECYIKEMQSVGQLSKSRHKCKLFKSHVRFVRMNELNK